MPAYRRRKSARKAKKITPPNESPVIKSRDTSTHIDLQDHLVDYLPQIRRIVHRIAKDEGVVDDITQECCVRIIEKENLFDGNMSKVRQWMNVVTRNLSIRKISKERKEASSRKTYTEEVLPEEANTDSLPEHFSDEHISWVLSQFSHLTEKQKQILYMRYFQNMTLARIGQEMNISQQTASAHIQTAISKLKKRARKQGLLSSIVFPWNWNFENWGKLFATHTTVKLTSIFIGAACLSFAATEISENMGSHTIKNQVILPINIERIDGTNPIGTESFTLLAENILNNEQPTEKEKSDLRKTLEWLKDLSPERFGSLKIKKLRRLTKLNLKQLNIQDEELHHLTSLPQLQALNLMGVRLSPKAFTHLNNCKKLVSLHINSPYINDSHLSLIEDHGYRALTLRVDISDRAFRELQRFAQLTHLQIGPQNKKMVTYHGIQQLKDMASLSHLTLHNIDTCSDMIKALSQCSRLEHLNIKGDRLDHFSIEALKQCRSLNFLEFRREADISDEKISTLKKALPQCTIKLRTKIE